ncbi:MAG: hypothetical protein GF331_20805 [Chitinivibrionales bacterium]|nr:hypothetical protein [Chitinivibrionales bacterium]
MIAIGSQYFRAPTPSPHDWERDVAQAKAHGLDYLRLWLMWNWYTRAEDRYDFSSLERLLDIFARNDMKAIMLLNLEAAPAWLVKKCPDAIYRDASGGLYRPESVGNTPAGGFPGLCFHHPTVAAHGKRFVKQIVRRFSDHPAVDCWEPHNEPMFEAGRYNDHFYCYCDHSIHAFRHNLEQRYESIDALNAAWRRNYGSFDEVEPPRRRGMYNDWLDWRQFMLDHLIETLAWRVEGIRRNAPRHTVMIHTRGGSGVTRNLAKEGIDDYRMSALVDRYGTAAFPQCGPEHEYFIAMSGARCAARGKPFWMAELQAGPYGMGVHRSDAEPVCECCGSSTMEATIDRKEGVFDPGEVTPERLTMWTWSGIAQGARGIMYWQYRNESFGLEYGFGLTRLDGSPHPRLQAVARITDILRSHETLFDAATLPTAEMAIAWDPSNDVINWTAVGCTDAVKNSIKGIHKLLWHADYPIDIVRLDTETTDDDFARYKVIYLPYSPRITTASARKLKAFVEQGGTLIAEGSAAQFDDSMAVSPVVPGNGLHELFGCTRDEIRTMHHSLIPRLRIGKQSIVTRMHKETLLPHGKARVIGRFATGEPAIVENRFGRGKAVYIGSNPFMAYASAPDARFRAWVQRYNRGVARPAYTDVPDVVARALLSGDERIVFVLNTTPKAVTVSTTVPGVGPRDCVRELQCGRRNRARKERGELVLHDRLQGYGVRVYVIGP